MFNELYFTDIINERNQQFSNEVYALAYIR